MRLRHARRADLPSIAELWTDAFAHDPYLRWVQPDDAGWSAFGRAWMTFIAELAFERGHTYVDDHGVVATAWIPPDLSLVGPDDLTRATSILAEHAGDERAAQAVASIMAARSHWTEDPHWTLQYIGVRPSHQGDGLGAAAIAPMLAICDAESLPCGLVSTNPRNVAFYERHGFTTIAEVETSDGLAVLRPMLRGSGLSTASVP